ncbi:MAG TPA: hypothetical protein VNA16_04665, partial [Abditibacteriaceae bacterium]|nr:hypothetical protein [Abditibacteriaceae bacterium]
LWSPRRLRFDYSAVAFAPPSGRPAQPQAREFLITSGKVFPPQNSQFDPGAGLSRIPPLYRRVDPLRLPSVLQLDKMIVGFERETNGPNRGLWRQVVRVFYASPFLTKDSRDDRPRAEALCEQFLKIHTLTRAGLGLANLYANDGVTTLWLAEVSSWWPLDDEDPAIRAALPPLTKINTPLSPQDKPEIREIENTPLWQPWRVAGQINPAPGEITFFKMSEPRPESEWVREAAHEYGHVALPPFDGFRPPLEPYANGLMGETLAMLWAAATPDSFVTQSASGSITMVSGAAPSALATGFAGHVAREAIPALRLWNAQGPYSPLRRDGTNEGLRYLQGLAVYVERVYGANIFGATLRPLAARSKFPGDRPAPSTSLNAESLLGSLPGALRDPFGATRVLPIWLPGAVATAAPGGTTPIIKREPLRLRGRERVSCWLFIPPTAAELNVEWRDARSSGTAGTLAALKIEGGRKTLPAPALSNASKRERVDVSGFSGWQRFTLTPSVDLLLTGASFTRRR